MPKDDVIEFEGTVVEALPNATFKVKLPNDMIVTAHISGKLRMNYIKILPGDNVKIEVSIYDPTKGRITFSARLFDSGIVGSSRNAVSHFFMLTAYPTAFCSPALLAVNVPSHS